jgi:hypothetical protein
MRENSIMATIIMFPEPDQPKSPEQPKELEMPKKEAVILTALPGDPMPEGYPDYRPILQRNGLFLYSWAVWKEKGLIVVNWLRSTGKMRKVATGYCKEVDLPAVTPSRIGDVCRGAAWPWREDEDPDYAVFAAPRLIRHNDRAAFLAKLRNTGATVNLDYIFTLQKQKDGVSEQPQPVPVIERMANLIEDLRKHPETIQDHIDDFISAVYPKGTPPLSPKAMVRKIKREWKALTGMNWR